MKPLVITKRLTISNLANNSEQIKKVRTLVDDSHKKVAETAKNN